MQRSDTIGKLFAALAKAQLAMQNAAKDAVNPAFQNLQAGKTGRYADLASVREAIQVPFAENGIAYTQFARFNAEAKAVEVETLLVHGESGEFVSDTLTIPCAPTAHAIGSAITYGRRFSLMAVSGVAPAEDDDGNAANVAPPPAQQRRPVEPPVSSPPKPRVPLKPPAKPAHVTEPDAEPVTAATLLDGTPHRPGLRSICERIKGTRERLKTGHPVPDDQTVYALNDAYDAWESWRRAVHPRLSEAEQGKLGKALEAYEKLAKSLDDAARKAERTAQTKALNADPETGELPVYEAPGEAA